MIDIPEFFDEHEDEFLKEDRIPVSHRLAQPTDLCAMLLLHKLVPAARHVIDDASHDEINFGTDVEELGKVATEEDLLTLIRCGVRYSEEFNSLCMFV